MKHRARRLAFEHYEDRRMLSGTSFTVDLSPAPLASEGGFLAISSVNGFLQTDVNNFLFDSDADSFGLSTSRYTRFAAWFDLGDVVSLREFSVPLDATFPLNLPLNTVRDTEINSTSQNRLKVRTFSAAGRFHEGSGIGSNSNASKPITRAEGKPLFSGFDFDLLDTLTQNPLLPKTKGDISLKDNVNASVDLPVDNLPDNFPEGPTGDPPGLGGKTAKLLVIDEPIQLAAFSLPAVDSTKQEGGTLEVAAAVHTTQHAYESQLSAVIASNLDRNGILPATAPTRVQPVVAELARMVAFETVGQQPVVRADNSVQTTDSPRMTPAQTTPMTQQTISAQLDNTPTHRTSASKVARDVPATHTSFPAFLPASETTSNLAERIEAEQIEHGELAARVTTFAEWPVLATVIAGYLWIERRSPQQAR